MGESSRLGWTVSGFRLARSSNEKPHTFLDALLVDDGDVVLHRVRLAASPAGRVVHVEVDGVEWEARHG